MKTSTLFYLILTALLLLVKAATAQPAFPTNVVVSRADRGSVEVTWDASSTPTNLIAGYKVWIGVASRVYNTNFQTAGLNWKFTNLVAGTTYFITVTALGKGGIDSDFSNEIQFTPEKPQPANGVRTAMIGGRLEAAPLPDGPWREIGEFKPLVIAANREERFFRIRITGSLGPLVQQ